MSAAPPVMLAKVLVCLACWWGGVRGFLPLSAPTMHAPPSLPHVLDPATCPKSFHGQHPLVLVSMDGFRAEYLTRGLTPTLEALGRSGVRAPYMKPSFPTKTFPNHYTIATGMYPSSHGIVANHMYDPVFDAHFRVGRPEMFKNRWWGGEPIWKTVENQGKRSATFFWPGSEVEGLQPTHWFSYNKSLPFEHRVDQVLSWIDLPPGERPDFITLYMHDPDTAGHKYGPYSPEVEVALVHVDKMVLRLVEGLQYRGLLSCVNLILLADHGMATGGEDKVIRLDKYVDHFKTKTKHFWDGTFARFSPADNTTKTKLELMRSLACKVKEMRVYDKTLLPIRWHMGAQRRVEEVVVDTDPGFAVADDANFEADMGDHGYDNYFPYMNALFLAHGPALRRGVEVESFQNIEVYNLLCLLVGVTPAPNNGTWGALHHMLAKPPPLPPTPKSHPLPAPAALPSTATGAAQLKVAGCEGDGGPPSVIKGWLTALQESLHDIPGVSKRHVPWGAPDTKGTAKLLVHPTHVTAYSPEVKLPLWTSFSVDGIVRKGEPQPWLSDPRLTPDVTPTCASYDTVRAYNISGHPLYPPAFRKCSDSHCDESARYLPFLISNSVPMTEQMEGRWGQLLNYVRRWRLQFGPLNVVAGPVFDYDHDSAVDDLASVGSGGGLVVPTHMFMVITRCLKWVSSIHHCPSNQLDVLSFVYPQYFPVTNCLAPARFAQEFSAKLSDVELITGLSFYPALDPPEVRVQLRVRLHSNIWGYESWWNRLRSSLPGQDGFK